MSSRKNSTKDLENQDGGAKTKKNAGSKSAGKKAASKTTSKSAVSKTKKTISKSGSKTAKSKSSKTSKGAKKSKRYFKLVNTKTGEFHGRYVGDTPKQAASKSFTKLVQSYKKNNKKIPGKMSLVIRESTRGKNRKYYAYDATRVKLDTPSQLNIKDASGNNKRIVYHYRNVVRKIKVPEELANKAKPTKKSTKKGTKAAGSKTAKKTTKSAKTTKSTKSTKSTGSKTTKKNNAGSKKATRSQ
jgi:hypothetical protein